MAIEWDASTLREKYGEPLARETFQVRHDLEMVVSYRNSRSSLQYPTATFTIQATVG